MGESDDGGTVDAIFDVTRSEPVEQRSSVRYATVDGTAPALANYLSTTGVLAFESGERSKTITVSVRGDTIDEADETFLVRLPKSVGATLSSRSQGLGYIIDDDRSDLSIPDVRMTEGTGETSRARFTVSLSTPSSSG